MDTIAEKRVYGERTGARPVYVASGDGLVRVAVSGDRLGEFSLVDPRPATDVAVPSPPTSTGPIVATEADVLAGPDLAATGFGPAVAVGYADEPLAADADGRVARLIQGDWRETGRVADVRAIDGDLIAAGDGIHRPDGTHVGLGDARDVAAAGPLAATGSGLYRLGNGWVTVREGVFETVAADGDRAHAATADTVYARGTDGWRPVTLPVDGPVVSLSHGVATYAVTGDGQFLASADGRTDWQTTPLGLSGVTAVAAG